VTIKSDKSDEQYWFPVTREGINSYLVNQSVKTKQYFELLLSDDIIRSILKRTFIKLEKKQLSKTLEEYSSIFEMVLDFETTSKKRQENKNWFSKRFDKYLIIPFVAGYLNSRLDIDLGSLREKKQEEFAKAFFLASVYLHL